MDNKRFVCSIVGLLLLLMLVILPGIVSVQVISHELYHIAMNKFSAKSFCVDINNPPYVSHVEVVFPNEKAMRTYIEQTGDGEERAAVLVGQIASVVYVLFSVFAIFWIAWIVTVSVKPHRIRKHVVRHVRRLKKYVKRKIKR